jgi:hypothetical protein
MGPMLRWFVFTIAMGLLPFGFSVLLQALRGVPPDQWQNSPELLFFSVMVSASQLDGIFASLSTPSRGDEGWRTLLSAMFGAFLLCAILAAALYGVYADQARNDPARVIGAACAKILAQPAADVAPASMRDHCIEWLAFQGNLFTFSLWMAGVAGVMGTMTEWIRTRRQP